MYIQALFRVLMCIEMQVSPLLFTGGRFAAGRSSSFLEFWKLPNRAHWCWLLCSPLTISVHNFHREPYIAWR